MNFKFRFSLMSILLIKCVGCVENFSTYFHFISSQTNCSFNDLKCINSRNSINISNIMSNMNSTISDSLVITTEESYSKLCVGQTYYDSHRKECLKCSLDCPDNARVQKKCNGTHDNQCVCNSGYFMAIDFSCKPCSQCESGWGVWRSCRGWRNTVCRKCPPGTFSGVQTGTLGCILCTKCHSDKVMLEECSGVHDSICIDKRKMKYSLHYTKEDDFLEDEGRALPIYFTVLIVIVLVLIYYVITQLRIKRVVKSHPNINCSQTFKFANNYNNLNYKELSQQKLYHFNHFIKPNNLINNSISIYEKSKNVLIVKRYNELDPSVRRSFEITLNNDSQSWKCLATELGYTSASIARFESLGRQHMNCVQNFLTDWSKSKDSTINSLIEALLKVKRLDCVRILDLSFSPC